MGFMSSSAIFQLYNICMKSVLCVVSAWESAGSYQFLSQGESHIANHMSNHIDKKFAKSQQALTLALILNI